MKRLPANIVLKIFDIRCKTTTAGPSPVGKERTELFLLGCTKAAQGNPCQGCFNSSLWDSSKAEFGWDVEEVADKINEMAPNKYITIGGGEPTDQLNDLILLCRKLKEYGFHIIVYTYRDFEKALNTVNEIEKIPSGNYIQIFGQKGKAYIKEAKKIMAGFEYDLVELSTYVDIIIDGEFDINEKLYDSSVSDGFLNSIGSGNQRIWDTKSMEYKFMRDLKGIELDKDNNLIYIE